MSQHVPEDLLQAFVDGEVGEQLAIHIAEHLDVCPSCLNRASGLEPLSSAFAALPDPEVPDDLVAAVLAEASEPERVPTTEIGIGSGLLVAAVFVITAFGNPIEMAADLGVVLSALGDVGRVLATGLASSSAALSAASALAILGLLFTVRIAEPLALTGLSDKRRLL